MDIKLLSPSCWTDYELIDSGAFEKLERFGRYVMLDRNHRRYGKIAFRCGMAATGRCLFQEGQEERRPGRVDL